MDKEQKQNTENSLLDQYLDLIRQGDQEGAGWLRQAHPMAEDPNFWPDVDTLLELFKNLDNVDPPPGFEDRLIKIAGADSDESPSPQGPH